MTRISKNKRSYTKLTGVGKHDEFLNRISKTLYYTKLPVMDCLSMPVTELAAEIFTEVKNGQTLERLDVEEASRISRNACVSPCSLVLALLYLERLKACNPEYLQRIAPSELFLVSLMVASKFLHDDGEEDEVFNTEWAQSGHLSIAKMNRLEKNFLKAIVNMFMNLYKDKSLVKNWSVYVHKEDFWQRLQRLEKRIAYKEACKRGWFSYTELNTLLESIQLVELINVVLSVSSICIATYAAGLITLLGSAVITSNLPATLSNSKELGRHFINLSNFQYASSKHKNSQIDFEDEIENILLNSISDRIEICNKSYIEEDVTIKVNNWKWIIDSVRFWLPNCSNLKSNICINNWKNKYNENTLYTTKLDFVMESDPFSRYSDKDVENIAKDIDLSLKISAHDWKYYVAYFSEISLSHGQ